MGVVVVELEGDVPGSFLHDLRRDFEIVDFVLYDWVRALRYRQEQNEEEPGDDVQTSAEVQPPLTHLQASIDDLRMHLDIVANLQRIPQAKQIVALLRACNNIKAIIPALEPLARPPSYEERRKRETNESAPFFSASLQKWD